MAKLQEASITAGDCALSSMPVIVEQFGTNTIRRLLCQLMKLTWPRNPRNCKHGMSWSWTFTSLSISTQWRQSKVDDFSVFDWVLTSRKQSKAILTLWWTLKDSYRFLRAFLYDSRLRLVLVCVLRGFHLAFTFTRAFRSSFVFAAWLVLCRGANGSIICFARNAFWEV